MIQGTDLMLENLQIIIGNSTELISFVGRQKNQTLGYHLKTLGSRETYITKRTKNLLLICYYIMVKTINFIPLFVIKHLMHQIRNSCHSVRDIYEIFAVKVMMVMVLFLAMLMYFQPQS